MIDPKTFKIRCSAIGEIMGQMGLTECQSKTMVEYFDRKTRAQKGEPGIKPLPPSYEKELERLQAIQKNPELPQGAKTYCLNWIKEQLYQKRRDFSSKYTEKGILMENEAIEFCSDLLGWGMVSKNNKRIENEFLSGEPDVILANTVEDIKCSWDCFSFPLFHLSASPEYDWQLQGYMHLTGKDCAGVNYCLMNAPAVIVEHEARKLAWSVGDSEVTLELYNQVEADMSYSHLPASLRHKRFEIKYSREKIEAVKDRVDMCRVFIANTLTTIAA